MNQLMIVFLAGWKWTGIESFDPETGDWTVGLKHRYILASEIGLVQ